MLYAEVLSRVSRDATTLGSCCFFLRCDELQIRMQGMATPIPTATNMKKSSIIMMGTTIIRMYSMSSGRLPVSGGATVPNVNKNKSVMGRCMHLLIPVPCG